MPQSKARLAPELDMAKRAAALQPQPCGLSLAESIDVIRMSKNSTVTCAKCEGLNLSAKEFAYEQLPENSIRLLTILPGDGKSEIECRLDTVDLSAEPGYTALSYTWGQPPANCHISLNGRSFSVRKNLWRFLHHRRMSAQCSGRPEKLWIDAICINQQNNEERSKQVPMMARIYQGAELVLVWLGPTHHGSDVAMQALGKDLQYWRSKRRLFDIWTTSTGVSIHALCTRRYWTRLWVLQELMLGRRVALLCGTHELPWSKFQSFLRAVRHENSLPRQARRFEYKAMLGSAAMSLAKLGSEERSRDQALWDLMLATQHLDCSETHDKVFALLGVAKQGNEGLEADYNIPIPTLLNRVLKHHHSRNTPESLEEVADQCAQLAQITGIDVSAMFSFEGQSGRFPTPQSADIEAVPLRERWSGVTLWWTSFYGHDTVEKLVFERGTLDFEQLLESSIDSDNVAAAYVLCDSACVPVDSKDRAFWTAVSAGHVGVVDRLLDIEQMRAFVNMQKSRPWLTVGRTPLENAAYRGDAKMIRVLVDKGAADMNASPGDPCAPLWAAVSYMQQGAVEVLLDYVIIEVNSGRLNASSLLQTAARDGYTEIVDRLLATGRTDPDAKDHHGMTPLIHACKRGRTEVVRLLLATGKVDPAHKRDLYEEHWYKYYCHYIGIDYQYARESAQCEFVTTSSLSQAAAHGHWEIVELLLATEKCDLNFVEGKLGRTFLHHIAGCRAVASVVRTILTNPHVKPDERDWAGQTPLIIAACHGNEATTKLLLALPNVNPNAKDGHGRTALHYAADSWKAERHRVARMILTNPHVKPDEQDADGRTPLILAACHGNEATTKLLLALPNVNPNAKDRYGINAFYYARTFKHEGVVSLLVQREKSTA